MHHYHISKLNLTLFKTNKIMMKNDNMHNIAGLPRVREKSWKLKFFQGQGIVREFCKLSGKLGNIVKCQGIVREFLKYKIQVQILLREVSIID